MTPPLRTSSVLNRASLVSPGEGMSSLQTQVDSLVSHFVEETASPTTLAAMTAGGMAYRLGRVGALALGEGHVAAMPLRILSYGAGLGSEVTAFEFTNRSLQNLSPVTRHLSPNLWSWSGPGGWREGLAFSAITFGMLRGAGSLAREQNLIFQHAFQSTAMVAGQNIVGAFSHGRGDSRIAPTLAEQFLHAEATNLQMGAGMGLVHSFAPGIHGLERGLDLTLSSVGAHGLKPVTGRAPSMADQNILERFIPQLVTAEPHGPTEGPQKPWPLMMASVGSGNDPSSPKVGSSPVVSEPTSLSPQTLVLERMIPSRTQGEEGHPYRLFLGTFETLLDQLEVNRGEKIVVGERRINGHWIPLSVSLGSRFRDKSYGEMIELDFYEGDQKGFATFNYQTGHSIGLHMVVTDTKNSQRLFPGAGTIVMDWFASHAARLGIRLNLYRVENPQIFRILERSPILDPDLQKTWVEIHSFNGPVEHKGRFQFPISDPDLIPYLEENTAEHHTGMAIIYQLAINVTGTPHPLILTEQISSPPSGELNSSPRISRIINSFTGEKHSFELLLPDWQQIAQASEGTQFPIAEREGRTIMLRLRRRQSAEYMNFFAKDGTPELKFEISEGNAKGHMLLFLPPGAISRHEIHTLGDPKNNIPPLPPGAGTIVTEWLATQAALQGLSFNIFQIENPQIVEILTRRNLMDLANTRVEICYWNHYWMQLGAVEKTVDLSDPESLKSLLRQNPSEGPAYKFLNVKGRPNSDLAPPHLRPPRR